VSTEELNKEQDVVEDSVELQLYGPEREMVRLTVEQLESLVHSTSRVTSIKVSGNRNINKGNFENEKFGQSTEISFKWFWDLIDPKAMLDPVKSAIIARAFANGAARAIGEAYRDIYVNHVYSVASRCRQLNLPQQKMVLAEMKAFKSPLTYDPFNVVKKDEQ
jgi:hypothetical protein